MELSIRVINSIRNIFCKEDEENPYALESNLCLDNNNLFRKSIVIELNENEIEVPVIARRHFEYLIYHKFTYNSITRIEKIVLPLYNNTVDVKKGTFDSIITQLFRNTGYNKRLQKITTSKGDVYYGGRGIILDEELNPLLLCTLVARNVSTEKEKKLIYYRPICHISPKVFLEPSKLVNKGIITKLIPYYTGNNIIFPYTSYIFKSEPENSKVKIIVDSFDNFFIEPIKPVPSAIAEDALNQCLIDNIEDVMMLI